MPDTTVLSATMSEVVRGRKFNMVDKISEITAAVRSRSYYGMFPLKFSIHFMRYVRHCRWQIFCIFDDVRITKMAVRQPEAHAI
jgi:hypothetical protein